MQKDEYDALLGTQGLYSDKQLQHCVICAIIQDYTDNISLSMEVA